MKLKGIRVGIMILLGCMGVILSLTGCASGGVPQPGSPQDSLLAVVVETEIGKEFGLDVKYFFNYRIIFEGSKGQILVSPGKHFNYFVLPADTYRVNSLKVIENQSWQVRQTYDDDELKLLTVNLKPGCVSVFPIKFLVKVDVLTQYTNYALIEAGDKASILNHMMENEALGDWRIDFAD
ncbi:MAG: hypothetical protein JW969_18805 [Spirochaetales bacterium]|nr:hypothetical protein [Spirochaetales bacterium]